MKNLEYFQNLFGYIFKIRDFDEYSFKSHSKTMKLSNVSGNKSVILHKEFPGEFRCFRHEIPMALTGRLAAHFQEFHTCARSESLLHRNNCGSSPLEISSHPRIPSCLKILNISKSFHDHPNNAPIGNKRKIAKFSPKKREFINCEFSSLYSAASLLGKKIGPI